MLVERILKIIIVGDSGAGKTSLIKKYINKNKSLITPEITIGIDFQSKVISLVLVKEEGVELNHMKDISSLELIS